jgi:hypothetical protein
MGLLDKAEKGVELGKTLSKYSYIKAKSLHDPEMKKMTRDLSKKWVRIGQQKTDEAMDRAIEIANVKLEESKNGTDKLSQRKSETKEEMKNAIYRADMILEENKPQEEVLDDEYQLMQKQLRELEELKKKQAQELSDLKSKKTINN